MSEQRDEPDGLAEFPLRIAFDSLLSPAAAGDRDDQDVSSIDLWSLLPSNLAPLFRPGVQDLTEEIRSELNRAIPAFGRRMDGSFGRSVTEGIQQAIMQFIDRLADPTAPQDDRAQLFRELGVHELYDGPILDVLQTAYRIGARVAWRRMSQVGDRAGVPTSTLCLLAEAIFAYIDELSALSVEGHASVRAREMGALERRRRQLLEVILSPAAATPQTLARLAEAARWPVPERVVTVALELRGDEPEQLPGATLDSRILVDLEGNEPCLVLAEENRDALHKLSQELPGWRAAVGPTVPVTEAAESLRWARRTLGLVSQGALPDTDVTWFDRHMSVLWLLNDPFLVQEISERALAPMAELTGKQRDKLSETLLIWLETRRSAPEIAQLLDVHPQTVRYRLRQLERLFGANLEDPDRRFDIEVALRARRTLRGFEHSR
ncbi:PucR family transcriptional regulator [Actinokineospora iranica]|uniref:PucR C-terminal helix-turn-helix domain-containing protein n=1 Tax=Actinokineospora iranica TaxID=1271860 RepID=A0A1G6YT66_9PSEU|nr:PucR family transcriptional regulator [Actinokineospora iranica]SDD92837.1 PucR C-terminal helix-turn-helix domain-containing protein [Actinokineospora iranica]